LLARSSALKEAQVALLEKNKGNKTMKRNLLALTAAAVIGFGGFGIALARGGSSGHHASLEHLVKSLNLTPEQQAKIQPILSQTRPQIEAIYEDAATKTHTVMSSALTQVRPLLTAEQQKKFDAQQKAYEDLRLARKELHDAMRE
jgi:Spy/CpxP family protein refolding chaperone